LAPQGPLRQATYPQLLHHSSGHDPARPGTAVHGGDQVGIVGRSGNVGEDRDPHDHFEVRINSPEPQIRGGTVIDPLSVLPSEPTPADQESNGSVLHRDVLGGLINSASPQNSGLNVGGF
jgi:hypothetical protein